MTLSGTAQAQIPGSSDAARTETVITDPGQSSEPLPPGYHQQQSTSPTSKPAAAKAASGASVVNSSAAQVPPSSQFRCTICQRTYSRTDHLARHFRSHTSEKAHTCSVCFKSFSRSDLLKRHVAAHTDARRHGKQSLVHASRVSQACKACARSKAKCKEEKPCQRCRSMGIECEVNETHHGTNTPLVSWSETSRIGQPAAQQELPAQLPPAQHERDRSLSVATDTPSHAAHGYVGISERVQLTRMSTTGDNPLEEWSWKDHQHIDLVAAKERSTNFMEINSPELANDLQDVSMLPPMTTSVGQETMADHDGNGFASYLRDIMMPSSIDPFISQDQNCEADTTNFPTQDLLFFGLESDLDLTIQDQSLMDFYQGKSCVQQSGPAAAHESLTDINRPTTAPGILDQRSPNSAALGAEAFRRSLWCWTPVREHASRLGQPNFTLRPEEASSTLTYFTADMRVTYDMFDHDSRDKILAMILSTCDDRSTFAKVVASFPSTDLLNNLMQFFLASHSAQSDTFIHVPTFKVSKRSPEMLGSIIASGAMLSTSLAIRKLGLAIQETVRLSVPKVCEMNNSVTRELDLLQALVLCLDVGLWSGNKRRIEMAEAEALTLVTMCRRASRMLQSSYPSIVPLESDCPAVLEQKWQEWAKQESLKRLVFHLFTRDAQTSISLNVPCIISYAELTLPLPSPKPLFLAYTAQEWRTLYLSIYRGTTTALERSPALPQCIYDISPLNSPEAQERLDIPFCLFLVAHGIWALINEFRALNSVLYSFSTPTPPRTFNGLVLSHRHRELCQQVHQYCFSLRPISNGDPPSTTTIESHVLGCLLLTHLHVSFNHIQLFAGREGEEESRRAYPNLQAWRKTSEARSAVWYAGQVIRFAKMLGGIRDFFAVAVYHASLTFWAYGVIGLTEHSTGGNNTDADGYVWVDEEECEAVKRFIALGRGVPCFSVSYGAGDTQKAMISEPWTVMEHIVGIFKPWRDAPEGFSAEQQSTAPLLVENLSQLIRELGTAARAVMRP